MMIVSLIEIDCLERYMIGDKIQYKLSIDPRIYSIVFDHVVKKQQSPFPGKVSEIEHAPYDWDMFIVTSSHGL